MKQAVKIAFASFLITAAAIKAAPALAEETAAANVNVSLVRTADLDLASARDRARLDARLARAAREVCGYASEADIAGGNDVRRCVDETLASARTQREAVMAAVGRGAVVAVAAAAH